MDEPYSGDGDLDFDGTSNAVEYETIVTNGGGSLEDFVAGASDPASTNNPDGGGGPGCAGGRSGGTGLMGDVLFLALFLAGTAVAGRRRVA